jgi:hypothetical protein
MRRYLLLTLLIVTPWNTVFAQTAAAPAPWYQRIRFGGDFRSRYEGFYQDDTQTRNRVRLRLRMRLDTEINEDAGLHIQIASGDPGTPVSTNQTFTDFFQPKPISLDRAYISYNPKAVSAITFGLGKFNAPQTTTQLVFDDDLNFEGGWEQVSWKPRDGTEVTLIGFQTVLNERSVPEDSYMLGGAGEVTVAFGRHNILLSAANYSWGNEDQIAVASAGGPLESILTNSVRRGPTGTVIGYASQFNVVDLIAEGTLRTSREAYPLRLLVEFARNTQAVTDRDSGLWFEVAYGAPRATGTWSAEYVHGWSEQDVTPSAFVHSDLPGTNLRSHILETSYVLKTGFSIDTTLHFTKRLFLESPTDPNGWLTRLHLGAVVRF